MPFLRQVWHVFAKDVRRQWSLLLLFAVHAAVAMVAYRLQAEVDATDALELLAPLLFIALPVTAATLSAVVVLEDAPVSPRAWWSTIALDRDAVFAAKLAFVFILIPLIALCAMAALHASFAVPIAELLPLSVRNAVGILAAVSIALPLASLLSTVRGFLLTAFGLLVASVVAIVLVTVVAPPFAMGMGPDFVNRLRFLIGLFTLLTLAATWRMYRTGSRLRLAWLLLPLLTTLQLVAILVPRTSLPWTAPSRLDGVRFSVELKRESAIGGGPSTFRWQSRLTGLAPELLGSLFLAPLRFTGNEGCNKVVTFNTQLNELQRPTPVVPGLSVRWRGPMPSSGPANDSVWNGTSSWSAPAPESCTPVPHAELRVFEPRLVATLPLDSGATVTNRGHRVTLTHIVGADLMAAGIDPERVVGRSVQIATARSATTVPTHSHEYALLHPSRQEAILLHTGLNLMNSGIGPLKVRELRLVMQDHVTMAPSNTTQTPRTVWERYEFSDEADFVRWLRGAELAVFELVPIGMLEATVTVGSRQNTG